jgi:hypothetical protein
VTSADLVRAATRAINEQPGTDGTLYIRLNSVGVRKYRELTRAVSIRGRRAHQPQPLAVEIDGRVYSRPVLDYRDYPHGSTTSEIEIFLPSKQLARQLAERIRKGKS